MMISKGTKLHCEHCGKVLNEIVRDLPDSAPIRTTDEFLKIRVGVVNQKVGGIKQTCTACKKESDIYWLILEVLYKG